MEKQVAYVIIEEKLEDKVKYIFWYNLKECDNQYRLYKFRKTELIDWYKEVPFIIQKELSADIYILIYYGKVKEYEILKQIEQPGKLQVVFGEEFDKQDMLHKLALQGNQKAMEQLQESVGTKINEKVIVEEKEAKQKNQKVEQIDMDDFIFRQLSKMDIDEYVLKFSYANMESLVKIASTYIENNYLIDYRYVKAYIRKIIQPSSAFKYIGFILFFDKNGLLMSYSDKGVVGCRFVCLCVEEEIERLIKKNNGIVLEIPLE